MPSPKASSLSELNESINNRFKKLVSAELNSLKKNSHFYFTSFIC